MAYKRRDDGRFRLRASFDIPPDTVEGLNAIAGRTGLSMASLCLFAVQRLVADAPPFPPSLSLAPACSTGGGEAENPPPSGSPMQGGTATPGPD